VNTPADEDHPSISADGRRLAFERRAPAAGTDRIIAADLSTGQTLDLFDAIEAA
jgi:Tol biopolymer transport system component